MTERSPRNSPPRPENELPAAARDFVVKYITSVAELEALLLMRQRPAHSWTAGALALRLYIQEGAALHLLDVLYLKGLVAKTGDAYRFAALAEDQRLGVDAIALAYPRFLIAITDLIHERAPSAPRSFADAFRLRNDS